MHRKGEVRTAAAFLAGSEDGGEDEGKVVERRGRVWMGWGGEGRRKAGRVMMSVSEDFHFDVNFQT